MGRADTTDNQRTQESFSGGDHWVHKLMAANEPPADSSNRGTMTMIDSATASSAMLGSYATAGLNSVSSSTFDQVPNFLTAQQEGLGDLTADDWKLIDAAAGKDVGPDAQGKVSGPQPALAFTIELARRLGNIGQGQELTVGDLKQFAAGQDSAGYVEQIKNAISYLEDQQTASGSSSERTVNITV